jgi:hypothetical protein
VYDIAGNVLLLRNNVSLSIDMMEISERELMSLVAEWLLDANSNTQVGANLTGYTKSHFIPCVTDLQFGISMSKIAMLVACSLVPLSSKVFPRKISLLHLVSR